MECDVLNCYWAIQHLSVTSLTSQNPAAYRIEPLEKSIQNLERIYLKLTLAIVIGLILVVVVCWRGYHYYVRWQTHKLIRSAQLSLTQGNERPAMIAAHRVVDLDPTNADGWRMLADLAEKHDDVSAMDWRRRVLDIDPNSLPNILSFVATALKFKHFSIAADALSRVSNEQKNTSDYHAMAGRVALAIGDLPAAERDFREASRLAPDDPRRQLALALFLLDSADPQKREEGRIAAEKLKNYPSVRPEVLRGLTMSALMRRDSAVALDLGRELRALPEATFSDRVLYLSSLKNSADPSTETYLANLQAEASTNSAKVGELIAWMNGNGFAPAAAKWIHNLNEVILNDKQVRLAIADTYTQIHDWPAIEQLVAKTDWGDYEFLRHALKARMARETGQNALFEKEWTAALRGAGSNSQAANVLERVASGWGWKDEALEVLWTLSENREAQRDALLTLYRYYSNKRDTAGLYRVFSRLLAATPNDPKVKNNFAHLALLAKADLPRARTIAKEIYQTDPTNPVCASTYAFSLYRAGDSENALKVLNKLGPDALSEPSIAAYYGIILSSTGRHEQAQPYLKLAENVRLLPEEERLVAEAKDSGSPR